jgi:cytoskeletal protein RodZ
MAEDMDMGATPPEESGNRMFLIGAIILGGIFVFALIAIFALYFLTRTTTPAAPQPQDLTNTAVIQAGATRTVGAQGTQTRVAMALQTAAITYTPSLTLTASKSPTKTSTPVVFATISNASKTPTETIVPTGIVKTTATSTKVGATAVRTGAPTALPQTGFGDSAGLPALLLLGGGALLVIILSRQIRLGRVRR